MTSTWVGRACVAVSMAGAAALAGCGGDNLFAPGLQAPAGPSTVLEQVRVVELELVGGDDQSAAPGTTLSGLAVRALNASGAGVPGVEVQGRTDPGNGTVSPSRVTTDAGGAASFTWTVPSIPGIVRARFSLATDTTVSVQVTALVEQR